MDNQQFTKLSLRKYSTFFILFLGLHFIIMKTAYSFAQIGETPKAVTNSKVAEEAKKEIEQGTKSDFKQETKDILGRHQQKTYLGTFEAIKKKQVLRVLTSNNEIDYLLHQGKEIGIEFEFLNNFIVKLNRELYGRGRKTHKIRLEFISAPGNQLIPMLLAGQGDLIAAGLTITDSRKKKVQFSAPYYKTNELIISGPSFKKKITSLDDFSGEIIHIKKSSSYYQSLKKLNKTLVKKRLSPVEIKFIDEELEIGEILELVSAGNYPLTIADQHRAELYQKLFGKLTLYPKLPIRMGGEIAWLLPKNAKVKSLLTAVNKFIPSIKYGSFIGNLKIRTYFKNVKRLRTQYYDNKKKRISQYDHLFQKYGKMYGIDWRLIAALAYQESKFVQNIKNRWGAIGVLQIKRSTASEPYIKIPKVEGPHNADNNIHAGVKYLVWLKKNFFDKEKMMHERDRVRMTLAAYNAGPGTIRRARRLASKYKHNPNVWFRHVENTLLRMRKIEPVNYVSEISRRFLAYTKLIP